MMWTLALLGSCWQANDIERSLRVWEMKDHDDDSVAALVAISNGDMATARLAGSRLAQKDRVPLLNDSVRPYLVALRDDAGQLSQSEDRQEAARLVVGLSEHCSACHAAMEQPARPPFGNSPTEQLWSGLIWSSDDNWEQGWARLGRGDSPASWQARRLAMVQLLTSDALR